MSEEIIWIPAKDLICPARFDIAVKMNYVACREEKRDLTFARELYRAHIEAFSHGAYTEPRDQDKCGIDSFFTVFDELIDSIKSEGVRAEKSVIPVSSDGIIQNGAHRVAIAAYFGYQVPCVRDEQEQVFDYRFFEQRYLDRKYCGYAAVKYLEFTDRETHLLILRPSACKEKRTFQRAIRLVEDAFSGRIIYAVNRSVKHDGCGRSRVQFFALEAGSDEIAELKKRLVDLYGGESDICCSTDGREETIKLACRCFEQKAQIPIKRILRNLKVRTRNALQKRNIYFLTKAWHFIRGKGYQ